VRITTLGPRSKIPIAASSVKKRQVGGAYLDDIGVSKKQVQMSGERGAAAKSPGPGVGIQHAHPLDFLQRG
jgi:hypothetical protein